MKFLHKLHISILFVCLIQLNNYGQDGLVYDNFKKVGQAGFKFLSIGVGTQNTAMGGAAATNENSPVSLFWNPSGIAKLEKPSVFLGYTKWFADINQAAFSFVYPIENIGNFGLSFSYFDYGDIESTAIPTSSASDYEQGIAYVDLGMINPSALSIGLSYSKELTDKFQIGGTVKYVYEDLIAMSKGATAIDLGTIYHVGMHNLKIAVIMQHFTFSELNYINQDFMLPLTFRVGFSGDLISILGIDDNENHLDLAIETVKPRDYSERVHVGLEYSFIETFYLRGGYRFNYDTEDFTLGFGLKYIGFDIGYSFANYSSNLGDVNRFDLQYSF